MTIATPIATAESIACGSRDLDEHQADEDAERGQGIGPQVGGVPGKRRRAVPARLLPEKDRNADIGQRREADDGDADPQLLHLGPRGEPMD